MSEENRYPCVHCHEDEKPDGETTLMQYDRYGIYAGRWHEDCWREHGYGDFVFDPAYAGERLDEDG